MAAEDELALPQVPEPKPDDPEDVSWSLSTAEAMWARGDHLEGIKWVRKAAEAASEVENDERALELAKAASELATVIARRSLGLGGGAPPEASAAEPTSGQPVSAMPTTTRSHGPPAARSSPPPPPPPARSSPPLPLRPSQPPRSLSPMGATAPPRSFSPMGITAPPRSLSGTAVTAPPPVSSSPTGVTAAPRPLATNDARQGPQAGRGILSNRAAAEKPKARRRSRENLDKEARAAGVVETAPMRAIDGDAAERTLIGRGEVGENTIANFNAEKPTANGRIDRGPDPEPTIVARLEDLQSHRQKSAEEWDASPTRNLTGDDMDHLSAEGDRKTTAFAIPAAPLVTATPPVRGPQPTIHDPEIQTTQAVRVVVWRDANGVHVAPAGTVVSAITIDAVLVVLEKGADLTAWLSQRER